jgi:WD40 repeat protein
MKGNIMAWLRRWWGWAVFVALLAGVGAGLHAVLPPQPRLRVEGACGVGISDDGGILYTIDWSSSDDMVLKGPLRIWDTSTGRLLRRIHPDLKIVNQTFWFSPDHSWLVLTTRDGSATLLNLLDGSRYTLNLEAIARDGEPDITLEQRFREPSFVQNRWTCFSLESEGIRRRINDEFFDAHVLAVVELASGKVVHRVPISKFLGVLQNPPLCVFCGPTGRVSALDLAKGATKILPESAEFLKVSPNHTVLTTQDKDAKDPSLHVWDAATLTLRQRLPALGAKREIRFSPDNQRLAVVGPDQRNVEIWDIDTGKRRFVLPCREWTFSEDIDKNALIGLDHPIAFSDDGRRLAGRHLTESNVILVFDLESGEECARVDLGKHCLSATFMDRYRLRLHDNSVLFANLRSLDSPAPVVAKLPTGTRGDRESRILLHCQQDEEFSQSPDGAFGLRVAEAKRDRNRWLDKVRSRVAEWVPALADNAAWEATLLDLRTGEAMARIAFPHRIAVRFSKDSSTMYLLHLDDNQVSVTTVWSVPLPRPWPWIVGVPAALGAGLLGVRAAWRRGRAKPACTEPA